jgi:signal transduction histidine kinase
VTPTATAVIVLCAITLYLATVVHQYVFERRREARTLRKLVDAVASPQSIVMMPSEPEVKQLAQEIHDTAEQAKLVVDEAIQSGVESR